MECPCCLKTKTHNKLDPKPGNRYVCGRGHTFKFVSPNPDMAGRKVVVVQSPDAACKVGEEFPLSDDIILKPDGTEEREE